MDRLTFFSYFSFYFFCCLLPVRLISKRRHPFERLQFRWTPNSAQSEDWIERFNEICSRTFSMYCWKKIAFIVPNFWIFPMNIEGMHPVIVECFHGDDERKNICKLSHKKNVWMSLMLNFQKIGNSQDETHFAANLMLFSGNFQAKLSRELEGLVILSSLPLDTLYSSRNAI